ncbi:MAG: RNA polymerase sigma factor [Actinomycetota bacterium]|nr:RNA polymerase sigma factor [Actinomycetota bacterium]
MSTGTRRDDASLLRNARRDPEAFGVFYRRHVAAVYAKFARAVGDEQVSLDLTAEVFARALERVHAFRGARPQSAAAWIHAIADRLLLDYHRSGTVADRAVRRLALQAPTISALDAGLERLFDERPASLERALARLPERQREVVQLRLVDELSYAEIALRVGISQEATRQHVSRGLRTLNHYLTEGAP